MAEYTWDTRERPILEAVAAAESPAQFTNSDDVRQATSLEQDIFFLGFAALLDAEYLTGQVQHVGRQFWTVVRLTEKGRRAVGPWPTGDAGEVFLQAIQALIEREPDPERKRLLRKLLEVAGAVRKDVLTQVAVGVAKGVAGVP